VQEFLDSGRITRIYLDELGETEDLPWGLALMALTILPSDEMLAKAKEIKSLIHPHGPKCRSLLILLRCVSRIELQCATTVLRFK
jgi:predicted transposase YdaD